MIEEIQENGLSFKRAKRPKKGKKVWRCIHDGRQVLGSFETDGETDTIHEIVDFDTEADLETGIESLGLIDPIEEYEPEPEAPLHEQNPRAGNFNRRRERRLKKERRKQRKRDRKASKNS